MLKALKLVQPTTIREASQALRDGSGEAKIYAGGAELLLLLRHRLLETEVLINIKTIAGLSRLELDGRTVCIGACVTHHQLETEPLIRDHLPLLAYAESQVANIRVRNQGTLGGNLCFNDPHSDPGSVLLVHGAEVALSSQGRDRYLQLEDFFLDPYETALEPDEILTQVRIMPLPSGMKSAYLRVHRYQRPTLGVAVAVMINAGLIHEPRLAVGCVGPKARRLRELESKITGATMSDARKIIGEEKNRLRELLRPVDDLLGSAEYKLYMTGTLLGDALEQAVRDGDIHHEV
jgi:carbon-monoxide dehydrogenase medium subunit